MKRGVDMRCLLLRWGKAEGGCFAKHEGVGGLIFIGDDALEDGILDGIFDKSYLTARSQSEGVHDELSGDRWLEVADAIFLLDVDELLASELIVVKVLADALGVLAGDVGFDQEHQVVDVVPCFEE